MPIYQRRVFSVAKPLKGVTSSDNIFTIPHTGEQFKDETEYRDRCELYAQEVWVCQCTGHTGLTHKEAWDSEHKIRNMLAASFPEFLHKPILSVVHHNTKSLDALIDEVLNFIHSRFHNGELVVCHKLDKARATVVDVTDPDKVCSSPSSDKENKAGQPAAAQPNGRFPPLHLPLRYTVQLEQSGRVVSELGATDLSRAERLPNRDMLRLFVRSSAIRQGTSVTAPWVVSPHLFVQHGLKNKIASIFLPSVERKNGINSSLPPKKRKLVETPKEKPSKKVKSNGTPRSPTKSTPKSTAAVGGVTPVAAAAEVTRKATVPDSDSDCEVLANIASSSKTKTVLSVTLSPKMNECRSTLSVVLSPLKTEPVYIDSDDSDDVKLSVLAKSPTKKLSLGSGSSPAKKSLFEKGSGSGKGDAKKKEKNKAKDKDKKTKESGKKSRDASLSKKSDSKKKQTLLTEKRPVGRPRKDGQKPMRQMSLFDLGKKVTSNKTSDKTPSTPQKGTPQKQSSPQKKLASPQKSPTKRSLPPCVRRLIRQLDAGKKVRPSSSVVKTCAKWLTQQQISTIQNERARQLIERNRAKMDEFRLMSRMTAEQKEEYLKKKKEEERRAKVIESRTRFIESRKYFEDQTLQLSPLPPPTPVVLPAGLPGHLFGDAVMVAEFLHCYSPLLVPAGGTAVPADQLLPALAGSRPHHKVLLDVVSSMLKVLLNDETLEDRKELSTPLRQVPVTPQTASELLRLALRPGDADSDADSDAGDEHDVYLPESLLERLEQCELFELTTAERLDVLRVLVHRLLDTDALADRHRDLCLRRDAIARDMRAQRRQEELAAAAAAAANKPVVTVPVLTPTQAGAQTDSPVPTPAPGPAQAEGAEASVEEADDLASRTKRSRRNVDQARREREEKDREKKEKREKEMEAERKALAEAALIREFESLKTEAARVLRCAPLGFDRYHRRYWLFGSLPSALYVEEGWADRETIEYRVQPPETAEPGTAEEDGESDEDDQPLTVVQRRCQFDREQATAPEPAANRWFCYTTVAEVQQLRAALALRGERESALQEALSAHHKLISSALAAKPEPVPEKKNLTEVTPTVKPANNTQDPPAKAEAVTETKTQGKTENDAADDEAQSIPAKSETVVNGLDDKEVKMETDDNANTGAVAKIETDDTKTELKPEEAKTDGKTELVPEQVSPAAAEAAAEAATFEREELSGYQFLISTLKEDILGIEEELSAGWLGAVPDPSGWAERVLSADTADQLGAAVLECEQHVRREVLQGPLAPLKGSEGRSAGGQRWTDAVRACRTLSRLHVLVGLLDSAIRWDLSTAQKKCRVCRRRGEGLVALCTSCKQLFHWGCLRPALVEPPEADWQCYGCRPVPPPQRDGRRQRARRHREEEPLYEEEEEEEVVGPTKEKECRVCTSPDEEDMIFCTKCPAAFHKTCHEPPMLLRVRPGWECMDCKAPPRKRVRGRYVGPKPPLPSALLRQAREEEQEEEVEEDEEEQEEGDGEDEDDENEGEEEQEDAENDDEEEGGEEEQDAENDGEEEGEEDAEQVDEEQAEDVAAADENVEAEATEDSTPAPTKSSSRKRSGRRPRPAISDDDDETPAAPPRSTSRGRRPRQRRSFIEADNESEEERMIRALSSDDEGSAGRRVLRRSSVGRRAEVRSRCRRQPRRRYTEKGESDLEMDEEQVAAAVAAAQRHSPEPPAKPSPSKVEMVQQAGAACIYCDQPTSRRNELAVCQSCPNMYHRRCATSAGLVDAWQCRQCVLPTVYRSRPGRSRNSEWSTRKLMR